MQPNISRVLFHSCIFAIGISPTAAMLVFLFYQQEFELNSFIALTIFFALIFVPLIFIQNTYLLFKRKDSILEGKIAWLSKTYMICNGLCLLAWIAYTILNNFS